VGATQRVEQGFFVGLTRANPGGVAVFEVALVGRGVKAAVQQARVGQLVDDTGVSQEVLHGPLGQAQQRNRRLSTSGRSSSRAR